MVKRDFGQVDLEDHEEEVRMELYEKEQEEIENCSKFKNFREEDEM